MYRCKVFLLIIIFSSCIELERDNPLDINNPKFVPQPEIIFSRYDVYSTSDWNSTINAGESVQLRIYLENTGNSTALNVEALISCSSNYITSISPNYPIGFLESSYYDDQISPGSESEYGGYPNNYYTISFDVSNSTPYGTNINFNLLISDESQNTWSDSFSIIVY